jgi:hypothetical protein
MRPGFRYAVLAILIIGILLSLGLTFTSPLLYTLEKDNFPSPFHENVETLKQKSLNSTTDISPGIQEFIDYTGPVSLNIRIHDLDQATRDLERFGKSQGSIKNLIVQLDMNESEIQELEQNTAIQKEILESLLNTSATLDSLQLMEIQYYSENNQDMLTTVRLRGDELRKKVKGYTAQYTNATEKVVAASTKLGLNVTKAQDSQKEVDQIVQEIEQPKSPAYLPVDTSLVPGDDRVSLFIRPDTGKYREIIEYMGISLTLRGNTTLRSESKPITLSLDESPFSTISTDSFGYYNAKIPIEQIPAGTHIIYARSSTSRSVNRILTVIPVDSATNLTLSRPAPNGTVNCTGSVLANYPVRSASVEIIWDQSHVIVTKTDADGLFMREIKLPPGRHTIIARFSGAGFPINPSESEPRTIDIDLTRDSETGDGQVLGTIGAMGILILFVGAAAFYIKRRLMPKISRLDPLQNPDGTEPEPLQNGSDSQEPVPDIAPGDPNVVGEGPLISTYARIRKEQGLKAASLWVYQQLAGRIAGDFHIKRHKTLTAREISRTCRGKPYCGPFARFISIYERIRYGGQDTEKDQEIFETALNLTDEQMGGENH